MKHIHRIKNYAMVGGLGVMAVFALNACEQNSGQNNALNSTLQNSQKNGAFVIVEEQNDGTYKVLEEYPSEQTRVMLKDKNGQERLLSQSEIDELLKAEESKINNGTSELTNPNGGGLGLGGAILASAAGAILGSYIGNKLFNNPNYQANSQRNYKSPQAYERSKNSFTNKSTPNAAGAKSTGGKSGFFGNSSSNTSSANKGSQSFGG
ncbi:UPF0323 family lipoprotein [Helicobacter sp. MIT 21-1697]|uniref:UPF0323 family lipoprotein n=1 Tax=Helicobacter sp. MIT 21-1697 TaxID=2993733 RepID=UPI00224AA80C|nr:UPF0323 family lipoprotein [Helicobacter sp. MIT 21-1697]MCX2716562.1 UPF0323 family lipoprotein [Helicobacter sp. MIT 21-1697]